VSVAVWTAQRGPRTLARVRLTEGARQRARQVDTKPASDILAGAVARAASQSTIHPLDTLKVRMQARGGVSKFARLVPPAGALPLPLFPFRRRRRASRGGCLALATYLQVHRVSQASA